MTKINLFNVTFVNTGFILNVTLTTLIIQTTDIFKHVNEQISNRDKLFKKFKKSKLHIDELIYKEAKNTVQRLIKVTKKIFFSKKLEENIDEPKELWKNL